MAGTIVSIAGSKQHTLNAIARAIIAGRELTIRNPYPVLDVDRCNLLLCNWGMYLLNEDDLLYVKMAEDPKTEEMDLIAARDGYEIDDIVALLSALKMRMNVGFDLVDDEDFRRKILILRRVGVHFPEDASEINKRFLYVEDVKLARIKFNFLKTNYDLAEFMALLAVVCDAEIEMLSKFDISAPLYDYVYPFETKLNHLGKTDAISHELEKRMQKLAKAKKRMKYHFEIRRKNADPGDSIDLAADPLVAAYATVMAIIYGNENIGIGPYRKSEGDRLFARILNRFGVKADFGPGAKSEKEGMYYLKVTVEELISKKVDEELLRGCNYAFAPLALLAAFMKGKTILRGLAKSSSLWRKRISGVAAILSSAGVRVGEMEDGLVIESCQEFGDIAYHEFDDPYLHLAQFAMAVVINSKPPKEEFFQFSKHYPHFLACLDSFRPSAKSLAS